jgi:hypothetical protein
VSGLVFEEARSITRSGLTDARAKFSVNLVGNPAMGLREFVKAPRKTIVGTSLTVTPPTGQYDGAKLINLGTNRWAFKPEVGIAVPKGPWDFDAYFGFWLFTDNDDFYPGAHTRSQDPVVAVQGHASYTFKPRLWAAIDATWYEGGGARLDGGEPSGAMNNSRLGATVSFPMGRYQSLKVALQFRRRGPHRDQLPDAQRRVAVPAIHQDVADQTRVSWPVPTRHSAPAEDASTCRPT